MARCLLSTCRLTWLLHLSMVTTESPAWNSHTWLCESCQGLTGLLCVVQRLSSYAVFVASMSYIRFTEDKSSPQDPWHRGTTSPL